MLLSRSASLSLSRCFCIYLSLLMPNNALFGCFACLGSRFAFFSVKKNHAITLRSYRKIRRIYDHRPKDFVEVCSDKMNIYTNTMTLSCPDKHVTKGTVGQTMTHFCPTYSYTWQKCTPKFFLFSSVVGHPFLSIFRVFLPPVISDLRDTGKARHSVSQNRHIIRLGFGGRTL